MPHENQDVFKMDWMEIEAMDAVVLIGQFLTLLFTFAVGFGAEEGAYGWFAAGVGWFVCLVNTLSQLKATQELYELKAGKEEG